MDLEATVRKRLTWEQIEGNWLPPWYCGLTYIDYREGAIYYHPIPLNFVIRFGRTVIHTWNWARSRPSPYDVGWCRRVNRVRDDAYLDGHMNGWRDGYREGAEMVLAQIEGYLNSGGVAFIRRKIAEDLGQADQQVAVSKTVSGREVGGDDSVEG